MGYTAITAFLGCKRPSPQDAAQKAYDVIVKAYEENRLLELLEQEAVEVSALMDKAEKVDDLERRIVNLEWNLKRQEQG
jgi:hypothetical protein